VTANQKLFLLWLGAVALFAAILTYIGWDILAT
jgi:hypothetical protein